VWAYGNATPAIMQVLQLRETLRPYVQRVMTLANVTGVPALRPMWFEFPHDAEVWWAEHDAEVWAGQFMLGPDYLVSPVTIYGATDWPVRLSSPLPS
jgi:alpha-D-xyloside xylohydrolase